ncbi:SWIM zinc finger family protein [Leptospira interrogans]|uniref:SWIM-type domain-containing protein n=1 Tax=Leptospira interrogans str. UI 12621 TaxID=1049937 RepID=A0A0F6HCM0_LEPIR|nr:hypothetical protein [Leptospira interrogans]EKO26052.1 hypothetical protein LEP1GSC104_1645 [Leptospira interrogans str. UI 12621]
MLSLKKAKEALSQVTKSLPSDTIIKRGIELFNFGEVHDLLETKQNHYYMKVSGTSAVYELEIQISSPKKTKVICNCPYDMDVYCKHAVAAILQIVFSGFINRKDKTKQPELSKILPSVSQKDLVKFLLEKAGSDPRFYKELTIFFSQSDSKSRASYLEEVTKMYHSFLDEFDFIDYQTSFEFQKEMNRFLDQAKRLYPIKPKEALYLASACAEIALEASMNMDDTNHYTMDDLVKDVLEMIRKSVRKHPTLCDEIFEICLHLYQNKATQDFGRSDDYYDIIICLDLNSKQLKRLQKVLEQELNYAKDNPYRMERIIIEIYKLFKKFGQSKKGIDYFKKEAIYANSRNQYKRLIQIMKQIASSSKGKNSVSSLVKHLFP